MKAKKLLIICKLALLSGFISCSALAAEMDLDCGVHPGAGGIVTVDNWVRNMPGTDFWGMDFCVTFDANVLEVSTVTVNDDASGLGGCIASTFTIALNDGTGCLRLGGGKMPGSTCPFSGDYMLARIVFDVLTNDSAEVCAKTACTAGCSYNFDGFVADETNYGQSATKDCCTIKSDAESTTSSTSSTPSSSSSITTSLIPSPDTTTTTSSSSSTTTTVTSICIVEEIYGVKSEEAELLRYFRDNLLSRTLKGQELIKLYNQWSPLLANAVHKDKVFKAEVKTLIDGVLPLIRSDVK